MKHKLLSILLCLAMALSLLPTAALAEEGTNGPVEVSSLEALQTALNNAADANSGDTTINLMNDITFGEGDTWTPVKVDGYNGAGVVTLNGNGKTITGLKAPLFAGGFGGTSGIVINNLTLENVNLNDTGSEYAGTGFGAFICAVDSMPTISLTNCHVKGGTIKSTSGARVGGLIGWTAGYNNPNNGPVDTKITLTNCSVEDVKITAKGSVGGLIGHAGANPTTYHDITDCTVSGCTLTSTKDSGNYVGTLVGTANVGQITVDAASSASGNTLKQNSSASEEASDKILGRDAVNDTGLVIVDNKVVAAAAKYGVSEGDNVSAKLVRNETTGAWEKVVAKVGDTSYYKTLPEAIAAAKDGETVILLSDCKNFVTNTINANITIDLNGKTLSFGNSFPYFRTNGEVTIQNGTITSDSACAIVNAYNKLTLKNVKITGVTGNKGKNLVNVCRNAEVTIDKDTVLTASGSGVAVFIGQDEDADAKYTLNVYGKVIQNSKTYAICGNGSYKGTSTINIYDGAEVKSPTCVAIYQPQAGVTNIYGGLVEGKCAIGIKSGALNISGGTVRGTLNDHVLSDENSSGDGISYDGSAIIVDSRATGYAGNVKINVTGGTVESYYSNAIREIGNDPSVTQLTELTVTGGNVFGASSKTENVTNDMLVRDISVSNVSVSGGAFNHEVPQKYCAPGFEPTQNGNPYGVKIKANMVAEVLDAQGNIVGAYNSLAAAIAALPYNTDNTAPAATTTIKLLCDTNGGFDFGDGPRKVVNASLDLNNNTLTLGPAIGSTNTETNGIRVLAYSKLEIKNGTIKCSDEVSNNGRKVKVGLANYGTAVLEDIVFKSGTYDILKVNNRGDLTLK